MSNGKIDLMRMIRDEKRELYRLFEDQGKQETADSYYWESVGLDTAIQILTDRDYYKLRKKAYM